MLVRANLAVSVASAGLALALAAPAHATSEAPASDAPVAEKAGGGAPAAPVDDSIVVTARRRAETVQTVPLAVTVVGGAHIENTGAFNVGRLTQLTPTLQFYSSNPRNTSVNIRGLAAPLGLTNDGKKALFVVSSDVVSLFGEGECVIGSKSCQLLALEPGLPETFVYGSEEKSYRIELLKIDTTLSAKPRRASLGGSKGKSHAKGGAEGEGGGASNTEVDGEEPAERG